MLQEFILELSVESTIKKTRMSCPSLVAIKMRFSLFD